MPGGKLRGKEVFEVVFFPLKVAFSWFTFSLSQVLPSALPTDTPGPFGGFRCCRLHFGKKSLFQMLPSELPSALAIDHCQYSTSSKTMSRALLL